MIGRVDLCYTHGQRTDVKNSRSFLRPRRARELFIFASSYNRTTIHIHISHTRSLSGVEAREDTS